MEDFVDKKIMYIYKIINLVNGKIYVGQHSSNTNRYYMGSGSELKKAKKEYGTHNFKMEILEEYRGHSRKELSELEIKWIKKLDATNPEIGYNRLKAGNGGYISREWYDNRIGRKHTEEEKRKISEANKSKITKEESKLKNSEKHKGKCLSEETRIKMSIAHGGDGLNLLGGLAKRGTKRKKKGKDIWCSRPVVQLSLNGEFIKLWESYFDAKDFYKIARANRIIDVCKGKTYSCVGYKWMFKEDYEKSKCYE